MSTKKTAPKKTAKRKAAPKKQADPWQKQEQAIMMEHLSAKIVSLEAQLAINNIATKAQEAILKALEKQVELNTCAIDVLKSANTLLECMDRDKPKGLQPGDYTDATKEVADALTAMGYLWLDKDRDRFRFIEWGSHEFHKGNMVNRDGPGLACYCTAEFLRRAEVTAKELGLKPVKPEPWKPGDGVVCIDGFAPALPTGHAFKVLRVDSDYTHVTRVDTETSGGYHHNRFRPATPEEIAEATKPKPYVPQFGDVVSITDEDGEWRVAVHKTRGPWLVVHERQDGSWMTRARLASEMTLIRRP